MSNRVEAHRILAELPADDVDAVVAFLRRLPVADLKKRMQKLTAADVEIERRDVKFKLRPTTRDQDLDSRVLSLMNDLVLRTTK